MARLLMPDDKCRGISVEGAYTGKTTHYKGHIVNVDNPRHVKALREAGATDASVQGVVTGGGYVCGDCGFRAFFRDCSRCGGSCTRGG